MSPGGGGCGAARIDDFGVIHFGVDSAPGSNQTTYAAPFGNIGAIATENLASWPCPRRGTLSKFRCRMSTIPVGNATCVFTLRKNGFATAYSFTVTSASSVITEDLTTTIPVEAGDLLSMAMTSVDGTGTKPADIQFSMEIT